MSRKPRQVASRSRQVSRRQDAADLDRPRDIFLSALAEIEALSATRRSLPNLPSVALPSLLERCEAVVGQASARAPLRLLICADGLEMLDPEWWHANAGGLATQRLPMAADATAREAQLIAFVEGAGRQGRDALTLCSLDEAPSVLRSFAEIRLLTWHPWASFTALAPSTTLDDYARETGRRLDRIDGLRTLRVEDLPPAPTETAAALAASFGLILPRRRAARHAAPERRRVPDALAGGPGYQQLCTRLGYDPDHVPLPPLARPVTRRILPDLQALERRLETTEAPAVENPARISWFLPRLRRLGLPTGSWSGAQLADLVATLDPLLAEQDPVAALATLQQRLSPEAALIAHLLAAAHMVRSGMRDEALQTLALTLDHLEPLQASEGWARNAVADLLMGLDRQREALEVLASPLATPDAGAESAWPALVARIGALTGRSLPADTETASSLPERLRRGADRRYLDGDPIPFLAADCPRQKIIIACHHKSGTNFLRNCVTAIARKTGLRIWFKFYDPDPGPDQWDICFHQHSRIDEVLFSVEDFRGLHGIRHPMALIVSAALYHEKCTEPWVDVPLRTFTSETFRALSDRDTYNRIKQPDTGRAERAALMQVDAAAVERGASYVAPYAFNGRTYREMLRSMPRIEDKLRFEMACFSHSVVQDMVRFPADLRFRNLPLEGISHDREMTDLEAAFRHIGFRGDSLRACLQLAAPHCLWNKTEVPPHGTTGVSEAWRAYFQGEVLADYRALFGAPEVALGY